MKLKLRNPSHIQTEFIKIDTSKCEACWKCLEACANKVIGKVDFFGHKHAHINASDKCTGCFKCVKTCTFGAYNKIGVR